jgi:hypothetical protein
LPIRFQVDPDFYDHPKTTGMSDSAFALWVRAGSFSAAKSTDGFISEDVLAHTLRYEEAVADELVRRRLWRRVKGGHQFHQYEERNLTKARIEADRAADRERKRQDREDASVTAREATCHSCGHAYVTRRADSKFCSPRCRKRASRSSPPPDAQVETQIVRPESDRIPGGFRSDSDRIPGVSVSVSESVSGSGRGGPRPEPACREHRDDPDPPACRKCKTAREAAEAWDAAYAAGHAMANAHDRDRRPQCAKHRGQLAHNCAPCRAERLAPPTEETP